MKLIILTISVLLITACSHTTPRTRFTDKTTRVMIDPDSIDANNYVRIQQALMQSGKFVVIDRAQAYNAIKAEQERLHRDEATRFEDKEKWAHWGKLYGVGGVIVGHSQCAREKSFWGTYHKHCQQFLNIVDSNTGEVIAAVENESDGSTDQFDIAPSWDETVAKLEAAYPKNFKPSQDTKILEDYRDLSKEEAVRQKESQAKEKAAEKAATEVK